MGFIDWFKNNASEKTDSQLDLLGNSQPLAERQRADRVTIHEDFKDQITKSGGSDRVIPKAINVETEELFGCNTRQLYDAVGGKTGDRDTLPHIVQKAYMHNEIDCTQQLKRKGRLPGNQGQRDHKILDETRKCSKNNKSLWDWNQ